METIITILIILIPIIFKVIEKKLDNAAKTQTSDSEQPIEDWAETLRRHIEAQQNMAQAQEPVKTAEPVVETPVKVTVEKKTPVKKAPIRVQLETDERKREKIDVKKLIVYSEIMKPKYAE